MGDEITVTDAKGKPKYVVKDGQTYKINKDGSETLVEVEEDKANKEEEDDGEGNSSDT